MKRVRNSLKNNRKEWTIDNWKNLNIKGDGEIKKPFSSGYIMYDHIYKLFLQRQTYIDRK